MTSGCSTQRGALAGLGLGGGMLGVGFVIEPLTCSASDRGTGTPCAGDLLGPVFLIAGAVVASVSGVSLVRVGGREAESREARGAFARLTKRAADASRAGDCEPARRLDSQLLALDTGFHETVFLADVAVWLCLPPAGDDEGQALSKQRDPAWSLARNAAAAARAGDCETVRELAPQLRVDTEFYKNVVLADAGIQRCLETAAPKAPRPVAPVKP